MKLTDDERKSLALVFGYLEANERTHYERNPSENHIWLEVQKAKKAVEKMTEQ